MIFFISTALFFLLLIIPSNSIKAEGTTITVAVDRLNVRSEPSLDADVMAKLNRGDILHVEEQKDEWVRVKLSNGENGWVAKYLVTENSQTTSSSETILYVLKNGTNVRKQPTTQSAIIDRVNQGDTLRVSSFNNNWYEVSLTNGKKGYVASWLVTNHSTYQSSLKQTLPEEKLSSSLVNKKIIIDPGHGGIDKGTTGVKGTLEKNITLETALLLQNKLNHAGAEAILTRDDDFYVTLPNRVKIADNLDADAFISIHYNSNKNQQVHGLTTYYYHPWQKNLAIMIHSSLIKQTALFDRGIQFGDYFVIRENNKKAVLIELGFLSNPYEESQVITKQNQESTVSGIYEGLANYFKSTDL